MMLDFNVRDIYLTVSAVLFIVGIAGILVNRRSLIHVLMSVELVLLASSMNFVFFSAYLDGTQGHIFTIFILSIAAAETAVGLALAVCFFRQKGSIKVNDLASIKG